PGPHRHLHSFPTRRSSDLDLVLGQDLLHVRRADTRRPRCELLTIVALLDVGADELLHGVRNVPSGNLHRDLAEAAFALGVAAEQDRKSTRLNSSHLVISYA